MNVDMERHRSQRVHGTSRLKVTATINWGTMTLAVSVEVEGHAARALSLISGTPDTPQQFAWDRQGNFHWGHGIERAIKRGLIEHADVIKFSKLCLYDDFSDSRIFARASEQLRQYGKTPQDLLGEHMIALIAAIKAAMKRDSTYGFYSHEVRHHSFAFHPGLAADSRYRSSTTWN